MKITFKKKHLDAVMPEKIQDGIYVLKLMCNPQLVQPVDQGIKALYTTGYEFEIEGGYAIFSSISDCMSRGTTYNITQTTRGEVGMMLDVSCNLLPPNLYSKDEPFGLMYITELPKYEEVIQDESEVGSVTSDTQTEGQGPVEKP